MHGKWAPTMFLVVAEQILCPRSQKPYRLKSRAWHAHAFACKNEVNDETKDTQNHQRSKAELVALEVIEQRSGDVSTQLKAIVNYDEHMFRFENFIKFFLNQRSPGVAQIDRLERGERLSEKFSATNLILFNAVSTGDPLQTFPAEGDMGIFQHDVSTLSSRCFVKYAYKYLHGSCKFHLALKLEPYRQFVVVYFMLNFVIIFT